MKTRLFLSFLLSGLLLNGWAAGKSDLPVKNDFGGTAVANLAQFQFTSLNDFTLEADASASTTIRIAGGLITYTPSSSGKVRFVCKDRSVFVFENTFYKDSIGLNFGAASYPDIFEATDDAVAHTGIYDARNLFLNPGFETTEAGTVPAADNYLPKSWTGDGLAVSGGSRCRYNLDITGREGAGTMMAHQGRYLAQPVTLQPHTPYKIKFRRWAHNGNNQRGGKWYIGFGSEAKQYEIFRGEFSNADNVANYAKYDHEYAFYTNDLSDYPTVVFSVYPYDKNGSQNFPITHYDRMTLTAGTLQPGITGTTSVTYLSGQAYAPEQKSGNEPVVTLTDAGVVSYPEFIDAKVTVSGKTDLHILGSAPLTNSTVDLKSADSWLFFDAMKPSVVIEQLLRTKQVTINGDSVVLRLGGASGTALQNARISEWIQGSVLIPFGNQSDNAALQVFMEESFGGQSRTYQIFTKHTELAEFNNAIRSFKLKRGYMATFANKTDGTGFSKVFIADKGDLEISVMPKGLEATASYIRVFRWDWVSKKAWSGGGTPVELTNSTSFYDWNFGGNSTHTDYNYALIKQKRTWPGFDIFDTKSNVNHLLGFNEPDHGEQHKDDNGGNPIDVETAIRQWPQMMASGLRLGSPAPTNFNWLYSFLEECDKLNYRVDFVAIHSYWYTTMANWRNSLKAVWDKGKRPIWITEWNNGANWTGHNFPNATGNRCDADGNEVINPTTGVPDVITLPCSPANAAKQAGDIQRIVEIMEDPAIHVERYFLYNWVNDARSLVLGDKLTPAGKWYAANPSKLAFTEEYDHKWKLVTVGLDYKQATNDYFKNTFTWPDYNGETAKGYILERNVNYSGWIAVSDTIPSNKSDVGTGSTVPTLSATDVCAGSVSYRYKVIGYDGSTAVSTALTIAADPIATSPKPTAEALSASWVRLKWDAVTNAKSYRVYRASHPDSIYTIVQDMHTTTTYNDMKALSPNTLYYYKVYSLNNRGESANAIPVKVITKKTDGSEGDGGFVGIEDVKSGEGVYITPNPVKAHAAFRIHYDDSMWSASEIVIEIYDTEGKLIHSQKADQPLLAPAHPGMYILKAATSSFTRTFNLMVN